MRRTDREVEKVWREFWAPIVMRQGRLNLAQVKRELFDFAQLMDKVPKVYMHVTGGRVSKPHTDANAVIGEADEQLQRDVDQAVAEEREECALVAEEKADCNAMEESTCAAIASAIRARGAS